MAGWLKLGWVTASLFIAKLQALSASERADACPPRIRVPEQNDFHPTLPTGRGVPTAHWGADQQGRGPARLTKLPLCGQRGQDPTRYDEEQLNQVSCLNLVTNAVVLWNTVYLSAVLDQLQTEDHNVDDGDVVHLSPARYAHINPYGKYRFNVAGEFCPATVIIPHCSE